MKTNVHQRGKKGIWWIRVWIPNEYRSVEPRSEIYVSLKTTNQLEAFRLAVAIQEQTLADLSAKLLGKPAAVTESYYREMTERSRARGFSYRQLDELLAGPPADLVARMNALAVQDPSGKDKTTTDAVLGMVEKPRLKVSGLPAFYEQENRTKLAIKTERELHKYRLPLERAAKALTDLVEDRYVDEVTYVEAQVMFDWLKDRVANAEITSETANKNLVHIRSMFAAFIARYRLQMSNPFANMTVDKGPKKSRRRAEFSSDFIRKNILAENSLSGMNDECRDILIIKALTGARCSEIYRILPKDIILDVPHNTDLYPGKVAMMRIQPDGRQTKNDASIRDLILIEEAYDAISRHKDGFPRYRDSDSFSETAGKYFEENGLFPSEDHVINSLRHSFEGRMTRAGILNRIAARMMGHSVAEAIQRENYGADLSVDDKLKVLLQIRP